jgi:hypothetical protein
VKAGKRMESAAASGPRLRAMSLFAAAILGAALLIQASSALAAPAPGTLIAETVPPSQVRTGFVGFRTDTAAQIQGFVRPEAEEPITYRFEWSIDGVRWVDLPDRVRTPVSPADTLVVGDELVGLVPNTTYHYRLAYAENGAGATQGEGEGTFTTRSTTEVTLPRRGIELVNQPDKGNQNIALLRPASGRVLVSDDGNRTLWSVLAGAPGSNTGSEARFLAVRAADGWSSRPLLPPPGQQVAQGRYPYRLIESTPDLRHFVMRAALPGFERDGGPATVVRLDDQQHQDVLTEFGQTFAGEEWSGRLDITDDSAHVLMVNPETEQIEEIDATPTIVSIMPNGTPADCGVSDFAGSGGAVAGQFTSDYHRIAATDGARLYFQAPPDGFPCEAAGRQPLYYRDREMGATVEFDSGADTPRPNLIRATPDGRTIYFLSATSHSAEDTNQAEDIYKWDAETDHYACLTCVVPNPGLMHAPVRISDDFSHIYFVGAKQLVPDLGAAGETNLYVLAKGSIHFVAVVQDAIAPASVLSTARMAEDGNVLFWRSEPGPTSDEMSSRCAEMRESSACIGLYRYEDSTRSLECVSCRHGAITANSLGSEGAEGFDYAVSRDGSTAALVTAEPLVSGDVNDGYDIYQWHNGAIGLISDGKTAYPPSGYWTPPKVWGVDGTGDDIFFTLVDPTLTGYEQDGLTNLYDARVGGGFPRPTVPDSCTGESCQGAIAPPSVGPSAGSESLHSSGNLRPGKDRRRCRRGKVRRGGRCVRAAHPKTHARRSRQVTGGSSS